MSKFGGSVGSKAGGFIAKKFFHPSSFRNQQRVWKAEEEEREAEKKQKELQRQRDEELAVRALREQVAATGSAASANNMFKKAGLPAGLSIKQAPEQAHASDEMRKRKKKLAEMEEAKRAKLEEGTVETDEPPAKRQMLAKSQYKEDAYTREHTSVWGSFCEKPEEVVDPDTYKLKWGYQCCKLTERTKRCLLAEEGAGDTEEDKPEKKKKKKKKKDKKEDK